MKNPSPLLNQMGQIITQVDAFTNTPFTVEKAEGRKQKEPTLKNMGFKIGIMYHIPSALCRLPSRLARRACQP